MKNWKSFLAISLTAACVLLGSQAAKADTLTITLSSPFQNGVGGDVIEFDATVTNDTSQTVYLNGDNMYVDGSLIVDDSPYNSWPLTLGAGDSYTGLLFNVDIADAAASGLYTGYFQITGGDDNSAGDTLGTADFDVNVTPEPGSFLLLGTGLLLIGFVARRRRLV